VLLTIFCIWLGVQVKWIHDRHEALEWLGKDQTYSQAGKKPAPWSLRLLGEEGVEFICIHTSGPGQTVEDQKRLERLFPEAAFVEASFWHLGSPT